MKRINFYIAVITLLLTVACSENDTNGEIDRKALVLRNNPGTTSFDTLASFSVGNGNFAMTVDATGLQSFPEYYSRGVPLGTQSNWGWHSFPNPEDYRFEESLKNYDFGRGREEPYSVWFSEGRKKDAANYYRENPHRLHLGIVGLKMTDPDGNTISTDGITNINQQHDLWTGTVNSEFEIESQKISVSTACHSEMDMISSQIESPLLSNGQVKLNLRFAYPTGNHADDAMDWNKPDKHTTSLVNSDESSALLRRELDETVYYLKIEWNGKASIEEEEEHSFLISTDNDQLSFSCLFSEEEPDKNLPGFQETASNSSSYWEDFWSKGGAIDFSDCTDERAPELERRVILSQHLMAIQSSGDIPPQETGLTYNSWFGKFHLEMHWWHATHFALWDRIELLERSMDWYREAAPMAREIAARQGFEGLRWMKMTDPSAREAPSGVGSFLIWQQPHYIYFSELIYRDNPSQEVIDKYKDLVFETAEFMASFASYDEENERYVLKGIIPAQETLPASETVNPPFELALWHYGLSVAQEWRERAGMDREPLWDEVINELSVLAEKDGLYLAAETAEDTYENIRYSSDHMAVLGALGIMPESRLVEPEIMKNTLKWVYDNWNWDHTWGWDYPMTAMCAARLNEPKIAVDALLMDKRTNTYLVNGHNYQDERLRVYLPGNGGLLTTVAMMCAGWDGSEGDNPGFPDDGSWNVKWEDLKVMP